MSVGNGNLRLKNIRHRDHITLESWWLDTKGVGRHVACLRWRTLTWPHAEHWIGTPAPRHLIALLGINTVGVGSEMTFDSSHRVRDVTGVSVGRRELELWSDVLGQQIVRQDNFGVFMTKMNEQNGDFAAANVMKNIRMVLVVCDSSSASWRTPIDLQKSNMKMLTGRKQTRCAPRSSRCSRRQSGETAEQKARWRRRKCRAMAKTRLTSRVQFRTMTKAGA